MVCGIVERWLAHAGPHGVRQDLFGFIDIIALAPGTGKNIGIIGIQSCGNSFAEHYRKITNSDCTENVIHWLSAGGRCELWAWRKVKVKRGGKAMRWAPRVAEITMADIAMETAD